ncbi:Protein Rev like [Actinidia chinensis var. chinensis]|uniref:Protein Rev like n=1 Tax=Actinidia chinensis var. chinensis TaxID=1590841 RepID=A0A2R6RQT2_ACTCC|nr:Protein Rev like [Actinidia chinensis var. chinensis]
MEKKKSSDGSAYWTNERHMHYLSSMEASFVRTMLENNGHVLRLDRTLPDSSESTLDLKLDRRRRYSTSDIPNPRSRTDSKTRRPPSQPFTSSLDQVVPQFENPTVDGIARGHPN